MAQNPSLRGQYGVASYSTLVGSKKQTAQADSVYPALSINIWFVPLLNYVDTIEYINKN